MLGAASTMCEPRVLEVAEMEFLNIGIIVGDAISRLDHFFIVRFVDLCERE
jgi:hypothetical protein